MICKEDANREDVALPKKQPSIYNSSREKKILQKFKHYRQTDGENKLHSGKNLHKKTAIYLY